MITLPDLPYAHDALEPVLSATAMLTHHHKHHAKYVRETNRLASERRLGDRSLEAIIAEAEKQGWTKLYNNAAQAWNHAFFWDAMTPERQPAPARFAALKDRFLKTGGAHFGSGWVWIVLEAGELSVVDTHDAGTQVGAAARPLIVCDLWEHAYYLDYKNDRELFLERWWDQAANWSFAEAQYAAARDGDTGWSFAHAA